MRTLRKLRSEQEGVSAVVGLVIVMGLLFGVALAVYVKDVIPEEQRDREYTLERDVEQSFNDFAQAVASLKSGGLTAVQVKMGSEPASGITYQSTGAVLTASPARYVDWLGPVEATYVRENDQGSNFGGDPTIMVSPTTGMRHRSYLKFDFRYIRPFSYNSNLFDKYADEYEDDVVIKEAKLWVYCSSLSLYTTASPQPLEVEIPVMVEARAVEIDTWTESTLTWANHLTVAPLDVSLDNESAGDGDWLGLDVLSFVKQEFEEIIDNQRAECPVLDNLVSIALSEPGAPDVQSSLTRAATFPSDNAGSQYYSYKPYLEVVFTRGARAGKFSDYDTERGTIVDAGYIKIEPTNQIFPEQQYIYEGGAVIQQQWGYYDLMKTPPSSLLVVLPVGGNDIRVILTRYRITNEGARAPGTVGQVISGTGWASISASIAEDRYNIQAGAAPNLDKVMITFRTDHPKAWREYIRKTLVPSLNYIIGGEWDEYGKWVTYDYSRLSVTIYGKDAGTISDADIYYSERVVDLDVTLR